MSQIPIGRRGEAVAAYVGSRGLSSRKILYGPSRVLMQDVSMWEASDRASLHVEAAMDLHRAKRCASI